MELVVRIMHHDNDVRCLRLRNLSDDFHFRALSVRDGGLENVQLFLMRLELELPNAPKRWEFNYIPDHK